MGRAIQKDLVIIGAGVSGLCSARMLLDKAEISHQAPPGITILEAAPYIGGRMRGMNYSNGVTADLGGGWFAGGKENAFFQWLQERYELGEVSDDDQGPSEYSERETAGRAFLETGYEDLEQEFKEFQKQNPGKDISLEDLCQRVDSSDASETARYMSILWMGMDTPQQISAREMLGDPYGTGGYILASGMGHVIQQMADDLLREGVEIEVSKPVTQIRTQGDGTHVICAEGSHYTAQKILITASAAALQNRSILFEHHVQAHLDQELKSIQMGQVAKLILVLKPEFFSQRDIATNTHFFLADHEPPLFIHARTGGRPIIMIFAGGSSAVKLEEADDGQVEDMIRSAFSSFPQLVGYEDYLEYPPCVTGWNRNPYTMGAYTAAAPGKTRSNPLAIGPLVFAGEAFVADPAESPTTLLGAFHSARYAAQILSGTLSGEK